MILFEDTKMIHEATTCRELDLVLPLSCITLFDPFVHRLETFFLINLDQCHDNLKHKLIMSAQFTSRVTVNNGILPEEWSVRRSW